MAKGGSFFSRRNGGSANVANPCIIIAAPRLGVDGSPSLREPSLGSAEGLERLGGRSRRLKAGGYGPVAAPERQPGPSPHPSPTPFHPSLEAGHGGLPPRAARWSPGDDTTTLSSSV